MLAAMAIAARTEAYYSVAKAGPDAFWHVDAKDTTYLRICFSGTVNKNNPAQPLDDGILEAVWLGRDELFTQEKALRSPLVLQCIDDYLAGKQYGMELLMDIGNV